MPLLPIQQQDSVQTLLFKLASNMTQTASGAVYDALLALSPEQLQVIQDFFAPRASQAEALAGTNADKSITPKTLAGTLTASGFFNPFRMIPFAEVEFPVSGGGMDPQVDSGSASSELVDFCAVVSPTVQVGSVVFVPAGKNHIFQLADPRVTEDVTSIHMRSYPEVLIRNLHSLGHVQVTYDADIPPKLVSLHGYSYGSISFASQAAVDNTTGAITVNAPVALDVEAMNASGPPEGAANDPFVFDLQFSTVKTLTLSKVDATMTSWPPQLTLLVLTNESTVVSPLPSTLVEYIAANGAYTTVPSFNSGIRSIDLHSNQLADTALDAMFTQLPAVSSGTVDVSGNPGSATCTPSIATAKGWTVLI